MGQAYRLEGARRGRRATTKASEIFMADGAGSCNVPLPDANGRAAMNDEIERMMDDPRSVLPAGIDFKADKMTAEEFRDIRDFRISKISLQRLARVMANDYGLNQALVCALCEVERAWNPWAVRHEAGHEWLVGFRWVPLAVLLDGSLDKKTLFRDTASGTWQADPVKLAKFGGVVVGDRASILTELLGQQASWGLMQIMGATARERGFKGWLTELCDPAVNLEWGCRHLRWMLDHPLDYGLSIAQGPAVLKGTLADLAAAWNGGSCRIVDDTYANQSYVDRVVKAMVNYE